MQCISMTMNTGIGFTILERVSFVAGAEMRPDDAKRILLIRMMVRYAMTAINQQRNRMKSEMPTEAGEFWLLRDKLTGVKSAGETIKLVNGELYVGTHYEQIFKFDFRCYDWHRIELPEGWR